MSSFLRRQLEFLPCFSRTPIFDPFRPNAATGCLETWHLHTRQCPRDGVERQKAVVVAQDGEQRVRRRASADSASRPRPSPVLCCAQFRYDVSERPLMFFSPLSPRLYAPALPPGLHISCLPRIDAHPDSLADTRNSPNASPSTQSGALSPPLPPRTGTTPRPMPAHPPSPYPWRTPTQGGRTTTGFDDSPSRLSIPCVTYDLRRLRPIPPSLSSLTGPAGLHLLVPTPGPTRDLSPRLIRFLPGRNPG